eukprot:g57120.t1
MTEETRTKDQSTRDTLEDFKGASSSSSAWFDSELFSKGGEFDAHLFVTQCLDRADSSESGNSGGQDALQSLHDDLDSLQASLKRQLVDLLNREYADFIGLAHSLEGTAESIGEVGQHVLTLKERLTEAQDHVNTARSEVEGKLKEQTELEVRQNQLHNLKEMLEALRRLDGLMRQATGACESSSTKQAVLPAALGAQQTTTTNNTTAAGKDTTADEQSEQEAEEEQDPLLAEYLKKLEQARARRSAVAGTTLEGSTAQSQLAVASVEVDLLERAARQLIKLEVLISSVPNRFALVKHADRRCQELKEQFRRLVKSAFVRSLKRQAKARSDPGQTLTEADRQEHAAIAAQAIADVEGCLRAFASLGELHLAEQIVRSELVAPRVKQIVSADSIRSDLPAMLICPPRWYVLCHSLRSARHVDLPAMLDALRQLLTVECGPLLEALQPAKANRPGMQSDNPEPFEMRFLEAAIWPEVCEALLAQGHVLFPSGIPDTFQRHYRLCHSFLADVLAAASSHSAQQRLLAHPFTRDFRKKWHLPVYFQLRFQSIAGALETALGPQEPEQAHQAADSTSPPRLLATTAGKDRKDGLVTEAGVALSDCLQRCWSDDVFLPSLTPEFFKLNLQLLSRFSAWLEQGLTVPSAAPASPKSSSSAALLSWQHPAPAALAGALHDVSHFLSDHFQRHLLSRAEQACRAALQGLNSSAGPLMSAQSPSAQSPWQSQQQQQQQQDPVQQLSTTLQTGFAPAWERLGKLQEPLRQRLVQCLTESCGPVIERGVPGLLSAYSMTNRPAPSAPSEYSREILSPLNSLLEDTSAFMDNKEKEKVLVATGSALAELFRSKISELETNAQKRERMLGRLKGKDSDGGAGGSLSDVAKMKLQLQLDVALFTKKLEELGGGMVVSLPEFKKLQQEITAKAS